MKFTPHINIHYIYSIQRKIHKAAQPPYRFYTLFPSCMSALDSHAKAILKTEQACFHASNAITLTSWWHFRQKYSADATIRAQEQHTHFFHEKKLNGKSLPYTWSLLSQEIQCTALHLPGYFTEVPTSHMCEWQNNHRQNSSFLISHENFVFTSDSSEKTILLPKQ